MVHTTCSNSKQSKGSAYLQDELVSIVYYNERQRGHGYTHLFWSASLCQYVQSIVLIDEPAESSLEPLFLREDIVFKSGDNLVFVPISYRVPLAGTA